MRNFAWWHRVRLHNVNRVSLKDGVDLFNCTDCDHMWKRESTT